MRYNKRSVLTTTAVILWSITIKGCTSLWNTSRTIGGDGKGPCAQHLGVNCHAGKDTDGSVICYDGWKDSGCSYSSVCN